MLANRVEVTMLGGTVFLLPDETTAETITVALELFAELSDGRTIATDPRAHRHTHHRRGIAAISEGWAGRLDELATLDHDLHEAEPERAIEAALEREYRLRPHDVEASVREALALPSPDPNAPRNEEGAQRPDDRARLSVWINLAQALGQAGVATSEERLAAEARNRFALRFDAPLLAELR